MAAKLGIMGLSRAIALDMARFKVRSNCIAPFAWTRMIDSIPAQTEEEKKRVERFQQMTPEKIAPLVVYLASDRAEGITGQIFGVRNNEVFLFNQPRPIRSHPPLRRLDAAKARRAAQGRVRPFAHAAGTLERCVLVGPGVMPIVYDKLLRAENPGGRADLHREGLHALCARRRARPRSDGRAAARLRLREEPQSAADHGGGDRLSGLLGEGSRHRHRLGQARRRRARAHAASAARAARHRSRNRTRVIEIVDKGPGKGALVYSERSRRRHRRPASSIATIVQTTFCRGDGGFGGPPREQRPVHADPGARTGSRSATCRRGRRRR